MFTCMDAKLNPNTRKEKSLEMLKLTMHEIIIL